MAVLQRFILMLSLWLVLSGSDPGAWAMGLLAAGAAAAVGIRLLPPSAERINMRLALRLLLHLVNGSLRGGLDVAWRAIHPRVPVRPGWIRCSLELPPGPARKLMGDLLSVMPGSLTAGDAGDANSSLLVHCLDTRQPVRRDVATLQHRLRAALGHAGGRRHD